MSSRRSVLLGAAAGSARLAAVAPATSAADARAKHPERDLIAYVGSRNASNRSGAGDNTPGGPDPQAS